MTSRHCFFKVMKEDFRHKIWMLALSVLGNLLALPVVFLIYAGNASFYEGDPPAERLLRAAGNVAEFFTDTVCLTGGIVAVAGAVIVGLAGFRYVFHRNMTDTYHSIPVKRRTLFAASWLNGFLIWFVPFFIGLLASILLGVGKLGRLSTAFYQAPGRTPELTEAFASLGAWDILREGLISATTITVTFLLVYHLVLLAVMLCGNVLNTLVLTLTLGVGTIAVYALWVSFEAYYLDTFLTNLPYVQEKMVYASPFASACYLLYTRVQAHFETQYLGTGLGWRIAINLVIALLLGLASALVYEKRPSELAEQGVKNKPVKFAVQTVVTVAAGMGGWFLFYAITNDISGEKTACAWGVFGGLLASVLVYGVLDIIFRMDFRSFFAHKIRMLVTSAAVLLLCIGFCFDWVGYDAYLPEKEKIAEMSVKAPLRSNQRNSYRSDTEQWNRMHFTDVDAIYDFLENATEEYRSTRMTDTEEGLAPDRYYRSEDLQVKVTLVSGRSYYRRYQVYSYDNEDALRVLASGEYMDAYYRISEDAMENATGISLRSNFRTEELKKGADITGDEIREICDAYNRDMEEHPESFICGAGRVLAMITLDNANYYADRKYLMLYEGMEHTREALRDCGFAFYADPVEAEAVEEIRICSDVWLPELESEDIDLMERIRGYYEVYADGDGSDIGTSEELPRAVVETYRKDWSMDERIDEPIYVSVTDEAEIRELLELTSFYEGNYNSGAFQRPMVGCLTLILKEGHAVETYVYGGTLPEKYIRRFCEF